MCSSTFTLSRLLIKLSPNFNYILNVQGNFRHASSNSLVSREELMMVLSRLDGLRIRGLYFTESQRLTLGEVGLEEVSNAGNGIVAFDVETCSCPPEYMGDSCQVGNCLCFCSASFMTHDNSTDLAIATRESYSFLLIALKAQERRVSEQLCSMGHSTFTV